MHSSRGRRRSGVAELDRTDESLGTRAAEEIDAACIETCERNGMTEAYIRPVAYLGGVALFLGWLAGVAVQEQSELDHSAAEEGDC